MALAALIRTEHAGDPEIVRPRIEDHREVLRRGTDRNIPIEHHVLGVYEFCLGLGDPLLVRFEQETNQRAGALAVLFQPVRREEHSGRGGGTAARADAHGSTDVGLRKREQRDEREQDQLREGHDW